MQAQLLVGGRRRELAPSLSGSLELGALVLDALTAPATSVGPAGRATLHYQRELAFAELLVAHTPELNVYLGQTLVSDAATLRSLLPLDRAERFRLIAFSQFEPANGDGDADRDVGDLYSLAGGERRPHRRGQRRADGDRAHRRMKREAAR